MICSICGGEVTWRGPLSALTHTQCGSCGRKNCQEVSDEADGGVKRKTQFEKELEDVGWQIKELRETYVRLSRKHDDLARNFGECAAGWDTGKRELAENAELRAYVTAVEAWLAEGEKVFADPHSVGFTLGAWWGRRRKGPK
jgi:hypothetical protein